MQRMAGGAFFGLSVKRLELPQLTIHVHSCSSGSSVPAHGHETAQVCTMLGGAATEWIDGRELQRTHGSTVYIPRGSVHAGEWCEAGRIVTLEFAELAETLPSRSMALRNPAISQFMLRLECELAAADDLMRVTAESLALEALGALAEFSVRDSSPPRWLRKARSWLRENSSSQIRVSELAAELGVHPVHLSREFRRHYRLSIGDFLRAERLSKSCDLLRRSTQPISEIAIASGFADSSHFSHAFRRAFAMSPTQYRTGPIH